MISKCKNTKVYFLCHFQYPPYPYITILFLVNLLQLLQTIIIFKNETKINLINYFRIPKQAKYLTKTGKE